jgi:hypothetical protein
MELECRSGQMSVRYGDRQLFSTGKLGKSVQTGAPFLARFLREK